MKKLTILAIAVIIFSGAAGASSYQAAKPTPDNKTKTVKKPVKKDVKKVPHRTTSAKKATTNAKNVTK
jgi:hypothetical protein